MVNSSLDPCIPYGRGGAGNMHRRSSITNAWSRISSQPSPSDKLVLTSSPEDHYASSKSEYRSTSSMRRRASSLWSMSISGDGGGSGWRALFGRRRRRRGSAECENVGDYE